MVRQTSSATVANSADKLEHVKGAVAQHAYEEEHDRILDLKKLSAADQARLTQRYAEEFAWFSGSAHSAGATRPNELAGAEIKPSRAQ